MQTYANPLLVAHRGASKGAPENTIPAFELAWAQGADAIEGDFHLTADGEIVCIHDKDTAKVSGTKKIVAQSTLEELRKLDVGAWFDKTWKGTGIPTLSEVLETVPGGKKIYIEVKCGPEILPRLLEVLDSSGLEDEQIVVISFNSKVIHGIKENSPDIRAYWLSGFKKREDGSLKPGVETVLQTLRKAGADGFSSYGHEALATDYVDRILAGGFEYHVWTIDEIGEAKRFLEMGVRSITTNRPAYIREGIFAPGS